MRIRHLDIDVGNCDMPVGNTVKTAAYAPLPSVTVTTRLASAFSRSTTPLGQRTSISACGRPQPEVDSQIVLGDVAAAAAHFVHLPVAAFGGAVDARADSRTVRLHANRLHLEPVIPDRAGRSGAVAARR